MDSKLSDFLKFTKSSKEVSLIVAKDEIELFHIQAQLDENGFKKAGNIEMILKHIQNPSKNYLVINKYMPKEIYDFVLQYPTGQIEIFDPDKMKSITSAPVYENVSVLLLITKKTLSHIQKNGFYLLENAGMTYQN